MFKKLLVMLTAVLFVIFYLSPQVWAGSSWDGGILVDDADGYASDDITIRSNTDNGSDGHITISDSGYTVFEASQGSNVEGGTFEYVDITSEDDIFLELDQSGTNDGILHVQSGDSAGGGQDGADILTLDGATNYLTLGTDSNDGDLFIKDGSGSNSFDFQADTGNLILGSTNTAGGIQIENTSGTSTFSVAGATGNTVVSGSLAANGGINVNSGNFTVATNGNTSVGGTMDVTGATTLSSTLGVSGQATLNGGITADSGAFTVANTTGSVHTGGTLNVVGAATLDSGMTAGTLHVGDASSGANVISGLTSVNGGTVIYSGTGTGNTVTVNGTTVSALTSDGLGLTASNGGNVTVLGQL